MYSHLVSYLMTNRRFLELRAITLAGVAGLTVVCVAFGAPLTAQNATSGDPQTYPTEVPFEIRSMTIESFDPPVVLGSGEQAVSYRKALVLVAEVDSNALDQLSPSLAPYLAIGRELLGIHGMESSKSRGEPLLLTFHAPNWPKLEEGAPMYLTTEIESILRGSRKPSPDTPRFQLTEGVFDRRD